MKGIGLKLLNGIYGWTVGITLMAASMYASYALWDNFQIYSAAEDVQEQLLQLKPDETKEEDPSFDELRKINEDVVGWITIDGTNIDYPILQGEDNMTYMNKDVYGSFSLAGSIFLDSRNNPDFCDNYSLVYGHNMEKSLMFGDLALFKDKEFFSEHQTATLLTPEKSRKLNVLAVLQVPAGSEEIFNPTVWQNDLEGFADFLEENSIWYSKAWLKALKYRPETVSITTLVTCSDGSTNDRTVLVLIRLNDEEEDSKDNSEDDSGSQNHGIGGDGKEVPST